MRKDVADLWVAALRSGQYEQGQGTLCRVVEDDRREYCCLGVLSQLAADRGLVETVTREGGIGYRTLYEDEGAELPDEVREWAGIDSPNPRVTYGDAEDGSMISTLAELNDELKLTLDQIADIIEEQYEGL